MMKRRSGFTLMEAVISASIMGVLALGMGSAVMVAAKAVPVETAANGLRQNVSRVFAQLCDELRLMTALKEQGPDYILFNVPDRNADGNDETVRYDWDGKLLRRSYNGGPSEPLLDEVAGLVLTPAIVASSSTATTASTASSGEVLLAEFKGWPLVLIPSLAYTTLSTSTFASVYFEIDKVTLPATLTRLEITKARFYVRKSTGTTTSVQAAIMLPEKRDYAEPSKNLVGNICTVPSSGLALSTETRFIDFPMTGVVFTSPVTQLTCVLGGSGAGSGVFQSWSSILASSNSSTFLYSTDTGSTWRPATGQIQNDAPFEVWGKYEWPVIADTVTITNRVRSVHARLTAGVNTDSFDATIRTLNQPVMP